LEEIMSLPPRRKNGFSRQPLVLFMERFHLPFRADESPGELNEMNVLIVGASRGIGLALVTQYLERGAQVFALVRRSDNEALQQLSATYGDRLVLLSGDMTDPTLIPSLKKQLQNTTLDRLIVNAGIYGPDHQDVMAINTEEIAELFSTNTVAPLRIVEGLSHCIADGGVVACMSSQMGSVTLDRAADMPLYGASKAALNSLLRSWASSHTPLSFSVLALHPGWVQTDMGGHSAPLTTTESAKGLIAVIEQQAGRCQCDFVSYQGESLPW